MVFVVKLSDVLMIVIRSTYDQVLNCLRYDLHCMDPPILTSGMLDRYGLNNYAKKISFWKSIDNIISRYNEVILYKSRFGLFKIILSHCVEEVYKIENSDVYIDTLDCNYAKCATIPRSHVLRVYLEGYYNERIILRINIITLLKLAVSENPYFRECLEDFVSNPLSFQSTTKIMNCSLSIIEKHRNLYDLLFNKQTKDILDIVRHSPIVKKYLETIEKSVESISTTT